MNHIKRSLFLSVAMVLMTILFSAEVMAEEKIGILMFTEDTRYYESKNGIIDQLKEDSFGDQAVKFTVENAGGSKAKAAELAQKFAEVKMDLIFTIGTSATLPVTKAIKDVPIVFCTVYDPVETGIAEAWKSSGNNTTGSTTKFPMSKIVNSLKEFTPVNRLAVLYTPGEKNSELQLKELQEAQTETQIKVIPIILSKKEEVNLALAEVVNKADAFYLTGSSIIGETVPIIVDIANKSKVVTLTHLDDLVEKGALMGMCTNSYLVGRLAGKKAVKILKGAKPASIPIETDKKLDLIINMKTAEAGQFQIPPEFMKKVSRKIQ